MTRRKNKVEAIYSISCPDVDNDGPIELLYDDQTILELADMIADSAIAAARRAAGIPPPQNNMTV
ncbi:MAG: hypothetical protein WCV67_02925 [Victivallaceae bacterium]|jgi:hypothetical protein